MKKRLAYKWMYVSISIVKEVLNMTVNKAYKFRLYPSEEQKVLMHKTFGCNRLLYNKMLSIMWT